ncbi:MAG: hypothetical protein U0M02_08150 [Acutalibacteraceae bacterium]|nr:hypothetical protein [Acutalibacteraceae bacterium]
MKEQYKKLINICMWCGIALFAIRCAFSWESIVTNVSIYDLYGYAGEAIAVAAIFGILYERVIWKFNPFEKTPKLSKEYNGTIKSDFDNIERPATLRIKQTLLSINITLITAESKSNSLSASIDNILNETKLTYCYLNTPKSEFRKRSQIHYGTATLSLTDPTTLEGQYYTDRATTGDMIFKASK